MQVLSAGTHSLIAMVQQLCLAMDAHGCRIWLSDVQPPPSEPYKKLKLNLFGWVDVGNWRVLTGVWWPKPFFILSYIFLFARAWAGSASE